MTLSNCDYIHPPPPCQTTHTPSVEDTLGHSEEAADDMANIQLDEQLSTTSCSDSVNNERRDVDPSFAIHHRVSHALKFNAQERTRANETFIQTTLFCVCNTFLYVTVLDPNISSTILI